MSKRAKLLAILLVCAAPIVLGTLAYVFRWAPDAGGNYGELIPPQPLAMPPFDALRGKWVLVSFDAAACDARCERKLYYMRQVRKAQGKDEQRVERLWLLTDAGRPRAEILAAVEGTRIERAEEASARLFPGEHAAHIYLVDPLGNLMLRFPRDPDPSKMLKDVQRLLKYSRFG
ncbi:MAG TPA: cytochrome C oxidase subunit I [Burkholderiales bacterium]|nr:cytochrome C oxidase subunit I [Burkholderiales bacterium]